jgi:hypothetical protein
MLFKLADGRLALYQAAFLGVQPQHLFAHLSLHFQVDLKPSQVNP